MGAASAEPGQGSLRDLAGHVLRRYLESGGVWTWKEDYIWGPTGLLATVSPTEGTKHYVTDHLGSPRLVCDRGAHTLAKHNSYPYGEESTSADLARERIEFTGQGRDLGLAGRATDDLDSMHARRYQMHLSRFLTPDPVVGDPARPQTFHPYAYALNNPLRYTAPWGLDEEDINGRTGGCDQDSAAGDQPCFEDSITVKAPAPGSDDSAWLACGGRGCTVVADDVEQRAYADPYREILRVAGQGAPLAVMYERLAGFYVTVWSFGIPGPLAAEAGDGRLFRIHALERMIERGVSKQEVLDTIATGTRYLDALHPDTVVFQGGRLNSPW